MTHRRPPRLPNFNYRGKHRYYVTFCTFQRSRVFTSDAPVDCVRAQILRTLRQREFELLAEVFMPDHVHILIEGTTESADFLAMVRLLRQRSTIAYRQRIASEPLWQDGYFDRVLRRDDQTETAASYIVRNPVAAGLVERPEDYPYLSSKFHARFREFGRARP